MQIAELAKRAAKMVADNSPAILTAVGVTGALTTAYLAGRATFKAAEILDRDISAKTKLQMCWKFYIPAVTTGAVTVTAIIGANRIGTRRAAALAAAYAIVEKGFDEYKTKIVEKLGEKKEQAARDEIAQERVNRMAPENREIIVTGNGSVLMMDGPSGRFFLCDMETVRKAENDINHTIIHDMYATQSDFYDLICLPHNGLSDEMGWNLDKLLEINFTSTITPSGKPCIVINYTVVPTRNYARMQ